MATISTYTPPLPTPSGTLVHAATSACNPLVYDDGSEMCYDPDPNDLFKGHGIVFAVSGYNNIFFSIPTARTLTSYSVWLGEDSQTGDRAAFKLQLKGGTTPVRNDFTLLDEVTIATPYYQTYGGDNLRIDGTFTSQSLQYFQLTLRSKAWGFHHFGARLHGIDIT